MKTLKQLTYVAQSNIHGNGLFARAPIAKGMLIGILQGEPCSGDGSYVLWLSETEGFKVSCNLRYINHACNANACYYDDLSVVALRDIEQDEEITHNYESADW
ncbi:MAG: SET domain-containing protein [Gammaproteobacteria bacterium]|nr:SET domain-containing protein [Gammaproteobacteria bacterium]